MNNSYKQKFIQFDSSSYWNLILNIVNSLKYSIDI